MELFTKLPQSDVELINGYINNYGGSDDESSYMPLDKMPYFLRYWSRNKAPLYQMFGEKFILKKEICFDRDPDQMEEEMKDASLVGKKISGELVGDKYILSCRAECIENIAVVKEIEIEGLPSAKRSER